MRRMQMACYTDGHQSSYGRRFVYSPVLYISSEFFMVEYICLVQVAEPATLIKGNRTLIKGGSTNMMVPYEYDKYYISVCLNNFFNAFTYVISIRNKKIITLR
jgi:hypothetical protein